MVRIVDAGRVAAAAFVLVSLPVVARPVVVVAVASDVQRIVIRDPHDKLVSVSKGDVVDGTSWRLVGVHGSAAMLESTTRYKGSRLQMNVTAGQVLDLDEAPSNGDPGEKRQ